MVSNVQRIRMGIHMTTPNIPGFDGYAEKYRTGKPCIELGCNEPAGTAWGPMWCKQHDIERRERVTKGLEKVTKAFEKQQPGGEGGEQ